jgi:polar amino acid transport system substrate-binding protein
MKRDLIFKISLFLVLSLSLIAWGEREAVAQENSLEKILKRGELIVGCDLTAPPYGTVDKAGKPIGLDPTLAKMLSDDLGVKLKIVDTSAPNRIAYLLTNKIDIAIAGFSCTAERAKSVAFTDPYFLVKLMLCVNVKKAPGIKSVQDLSGHSVAVNKGSTPHLALKKVAPQGTEIQLYDAASAAALAAQSGKADAFVEGYVIADSYVRKYPGTLEIRGEPLKSDPVSFGVRHQDLIWRHYVNTWLDLKYRDGTLKMLFEEWMKLPWKAGDPR